MNRAFDDDRSVGSAKSGKSLLAQLFFQNAAVKVAVLIGETSGSGDYPLCDTPWTFCLASHHVNDHKFSDHELVPKPVTSLKTDWSDGRVVRSTKTKKQVSQQQMTVVTAPPRPDGGCGGPRPPAAVPIVTAVIVP